MPWKAFWQTIILIVIAAFIFGIANFCVKVVGWKVCHRDKRMMMERREMPEGGGRMMRQREEK